MNENSRIKQFSLVFVVIVSIGVAFLILFRHFNKIPYRFSSSVEAKVTIYHEDSHEIAAQIEPVAEFTFTGEKTVRLEAGSYLFIASNIVEEKTLRSEYYRTVTERGGLDIDFKNQAEVVGFSRATKIKDTELDSNLARYRRDGIYEFFDFSTNKRGALSFDIDTSLFNPTLRVFDVQAVCVSTKKNGYALINDLLFKVTDGRAVGSPLYLGTQNTNGFGKITKTSNSLEGEDLFVLDRTSQTNCQSSSLVVQGPHDGYIFKPDGIYVYTESMGYTKNSTVSGNKGHLFAVFNNNLEEYIEAQGFDPEGEDASDHSVPTETTVTIIDFNKRTITSSKLPGAVTEYVPSSSTKGIVVGTEGISVVTDLTTSQTEQLYGVLLAEKVTALSLLDNGSIIIEYAASAIYELDIEKRSAHLLFEDGTISPGSFTADNNGNLAITLQKPAEIVSTVSEQEIVFLKIR